MNGPPEGPSHGTVGASILIIEDEDPVRSFLREALQGAGSAKGQVINISMGGCAVESETIVEPGTPVRLRIVFPRWPLLLH